jgi:hypothetical protein
MRRVLTLSALCLCACSVNAADYVCDQYWTTEKKRYARTGIVLETGIEGFKVGQPAPDLLKKLGPILCAAGTEELRVRRIADRSYLGDPARHAERGIRLEEHIGGRPVRQSWVNIGLNIETNEIMMVVARFLPDRSLDREPRLTAAQARSKVEARLRKDTYVETESTGRVKIAFIDKPAYLAYEIHEFGFEPARGVLVWVFSADGVDHMQWYEVSVSADSGEVVNLQGMMIVETN